MLSAFKFSVRVAAQARLCCLVAHPRQLFCPASMSKRKAAKRDIEEELEVLSEEDDEVRSRPCAVLVCVQQKFRSDSTANNSWPQIRSPPSTSAAAAHSVSVLLVVYIVHPTKQEPVPKKRQPKPKKAKFTEPFTDNLGWHVEPPSLIWRWVHWGVSSCTTRGMCAWTLGLVKE